LRAAIEKYHDRVVLGSNFSDDGRQLLLPSVVMPESIPTESIAGYVNYWPDFDGGVRRERSRTTVSDVAHVEPFPGEQPVLSFTALVARRTTPDGLINFAGPSGTYPVHPFYEMFYDKAWTRNLQDGAVFRDKIVLIGPAGNFQHDQHPTPFGRMDGVEIHANVIATLLHGDGPREARSIVGIVSVLALALATAMLLNLATHPLGKLGLLVAVGAAYFTVTQVAFASRGMVLWVAAPLWTVAGGGVAGIASQLLAEQLEKRRVRQTLERYVSKPVADEVLRHGEEYQNSLGGERKPVTILFSDIRGFTTIAEQATPSELVGQLNEYLTAMVDIVMEHNGTLDKFIGDAIMAVYGAPLSAGAVEDAWRAVQTASRMRSRLAELQKGWAAQGRPRLEIGVGINHGEALVGNIGSPQRMEYTVIGDVVNVASRVEGLNKEFGTDVLLTESVYEMVKERVEVKQMGMAEVKGREQKVMVYLLVRLKT
jgi:adenylate cyclase